MPTSFGRSPRVRSIGGSGCSCQSFLSFAAFGGFCATSSMVGGFALTSSSGTAKFASSFASSVIVYPCADAVQRNFSSRSADLSSSIVAGRTPFDHSTRIPSARNSSRPRAATYAPGFASRA